jgi:glycosyltransferase involved in cell wall biosynthesis
VTRVAAVVPARNEADRIEATVKGLSEIAGQVVVIDDASVDGTGSVAEAAGATMVRAPHRMGKGGALELGIAAVESSPDLWVFADADLGESARELALLVEQVASGSCDLAIAVLPKQGGGFGLVKRGAGMAIRLLGGARVSEPLSGQRALTAQALAACRPLAPGFGVETAMTIDASRLGLRVLEVQTAIRHRGTRKDLAGFRHRGRQGWDIMRAVALRAVTR